MKPSDTYMQGPAMTDLLLSCSNHHDFKISDPTSSWVQHNPETVSIVPLPNYTISWDGSAQCDPGEILFDCLGCDEHQVILDT